MLPDGSPGARAEARGTSGALVLRTSWERGSVLRRRDEVSLGRDDECRAGEMRRKERRRRGLRHVLANVPALSKCGLAACLAVGLNSSRVTLRRNVGPDKSTPGDVRLYFADTSRLLCLAATRGCRVWLETHESHEWAMGQCGRICGSPAFHLGKRENPSRASRPADQQSGRVSDGESRSTQARVIACERAISTALRTIAYKTRSSPDAHAFATFARLELPSANRISGRVSSIARDGFGIVRFLPRTSTCGRNLRISQL